MLELNVCNRDANSTGRLLTRGTTTIVLVTFLIAVAKHSTKATQGNRVCLGSWFKGYSLTARGRHDMEAQFMVVGTWVKAGHISANEEAETGEARPLVTKRRL